MEVDISSDQAIERSVIESTSTPGWMERAYNSRILLRILFDQLIRVNSLNIDNIIRVVQNFCRKYSLILIDIENAVKSLKPRGGMADGPYEKTTRGFTAELMKRDRDCFYCAVAVCVYRFDRIKDCIRPVGRCAAIR